MAEHPMRRGTRGGNVPHKARTVVMLAAVGLGMVGLSFASVPLYRVFCQATGYGGTTQRAEAAPERIASDLVTVRFDTEVSPDLAWEFRPLQPQIQLHPGEEKQVFFRAINRSREAITGAATYNVAPAKAGIYFDKVQCFCFNQQLLGPGESKDMGVVFFVDPDIEKDPSTQDVRTITLSYTMFRAHTQQSPDEQQNKGPSATPGARAGLDGKSAGAVN